MEEEGDDDDEDDDDEEEDMEADEEEDAQSACGDIDTHEKRTKQSNTIMENARERNENHTHIHPGEQGSRVSQIKACEHCFLHRIQKLTGLRFDRQL
jgi:hypothetical protein